MHPDAPQGRRRSARRTPNANPYLSITRSDAAPGEVAVVAEYLGMRIFRLDMAASHFTDQFMGKFRKLVESEMPTHTEDCHLRLMRDDGDVSRSRPPAA